MALLHRATMSPTKLELLSGWLPSRSWCGEPAGLEPLGSYRFDDPAGEVGVETLLLASVQGHVLQVPLTYRNAPVLGADQFLVGTAEHSVLGTRWIYDGCSDPVWVAQLAATIVDGGAQAEEFFDVDGRREPRAASVQVRGSGAPRRVARVDAVTTRDDDALTVTAAGGFEVVLARVVGAEVNTPHTLTGTWADADDVTLAGLRFS